jgi:hypothetical protein
MKSYLFKDKPNKENVKAPEPVKPAEPERKSNFFEKKRFNGLTEEQEKMLEEHDKKKESEK